MSRRPSVFLIAFVLAVVALAATVRVGTYQATVDATPTEAGDAAEPTTVGALPAARRPFARSLAAGGRVSMTERRIALGPGSVVVRRTPEAGWRVRVAPCAESFSEIGPSDPLTVADQLYRLSGQYERSTEAAMPAFEAPRVIGAIVLPALIVYRFVVGPPDVAE